MKKIAIVILSILLLCSCSNNEVETNVISEDEAIKQVNNGAYLVDVRIEEEYNEKHIRGSINVPLDQIDSLFSSSVTEEKEAFIIVYCKSGMRATSAQEKLTNMGYTNVYSVGGIDNWNHTDMIE